MHCKLLSWVLLPTYAISDVVKSQLLACSLWPMLTSCHGLCLITLHATIVFVLQVMPTQDSFDPMLYLAIMHGETTLSDLKTGQQNLSFEVSERTGQLKDLVSEQTPSRLTLLQACMHIALLVLASACMPVNTSLRTECGNWSYSTS